jgi:glycosyltransferase involved in cell wall biosynthesis
MSKLFYVAEINLPSFRAYTIHVLKIVDAFTNTLKTQLIIPFSSKTYHYKKIKNDFLLTSKKKFQIINIFDKVFVSTMINRVCFGFKSALYLKTKANAIIITRSITTSLFLIFFKKKHILEIHQKFTRLSHFFFIFLNIIESKYIINIIFITRAIQNEYKNKNINFLVLPDGVNLKNFKYKIKIKKHIKNIYYIGSFYKGRGIEIIFKLAKFFANKNFFLYGHRDEYIPNNIKNIKNIKIYKFIKYNEVPRVAENADLFLMPYSLKEVKMNSEGKISNIAKYTSPIKMFEYLASGTPIVASNLPVLKEILIHNKNSLIVRNNSINNWVKSINLIDRNLSLRKLISQRAYETAKIHTWEKRAKRILDSIKVGIYKP